MSLYLRWAFKWERNRKFMTGITVRPCFCRNALHAKIPLSSQREQSKDRPSASTSLVHRQDLPSGHGLGHQSLQSHFLLLQILWCRVFNFQLCHSITKGGFDLLLVSSLQLHR